MSLFKEINAELSTHEDKVAILENVSSLTASQIDDLVDYVIDMQKKGDVTDPQELAYTALEDIPGMETADKATKGNIVGNIEAGVAKRNKANKIPKANRNSKDFKDLMSG